MQNGRWGHSSGARQIKVRLKIEWYIIVVEYSESECGE